MAEHMGQPNRMESGKRAEHMGQPNRMEASSRMLAVKTSIGINRETDCNNKEEDQINIL